MSVRRLAGRPPFTVALLTLVVVLTAGTGLVIGAVAWREQRAYSRAIADAAMAQAARLVALNTARFLRDAESAVRVGPEMVDQGQLDPDNAADLERYVLAMLHAHPQLSWVSYGDRDDRFTGAWRDGEGRVYLNRSFPRGGRIHLEEDRVLPGGGRQPTRRSGDHRYRPRERPYFQLATARRGLVWTEPYEFYASGGLGITCAAPVLAADGDVRGVFTVDFSLQRLAAFLDAVEVSPRGHVVLASSRAGVIAQQQRRPAAMDAGELAALRARIAHDQETTFDVEHGGERFLGRSAPVAIADLGWFAEVVVPERDYTERVDAQARRGVLLVLGVLIVAVAGGVAVARWIARPLRELAEQARRIRAGKLDVTVVPRSRDEIGTLTRAMGDMARALRDREFVREALGRYVSPEVAERCLRDPTALHLGGELREVAILMSDLRDFSGLSERLGPEGTIDILNRYLATMTPIILRHGGMINEFIGDGILVLFGVPFPREDDADRAIRCAAAMQAVVPVFNEDSRARGLPELSMGIALHAGAVVAGNIGSRDRVKYGVVGTPVNLASRIQAVAIGGEVLLTAAMAERTRLALRTGPPRILQIKGASEPVTVYSLLDAKE
jgi:class 3 adenylate cyclase